MLALIKIRGKYFLRHKCILCWSYLLIPILILIFIIITLLTEDIRLRDVIYFDKYQNKRTNNRTFFMMNRTQTKHINILKLFCQKLLL